MGFDRHAWSLAARAAAAAGALLIAGHVLIASEAYVASLLAVGLGAALVVDLMRQVRRLEVRMEAFASAVAAGDPVRWLPERASERAMAAAFAKATTQLSDEHVARERESAALHALIQNSPLALLEAREGGFVLLNSAAERLFGRRASEGVARYGDFGRAFQDAMTLDAADTVFVSADLPGGRRRIAVRRAPWRVADDDRVLISVEDVDGALEGAELQAWRTMARVLSHEIMNALTAILALNHAAQDRLLAKDDARAGDGETLNEAREALAAASRRGQGLMRFVEGYRATLATPTPNPRRTDLSDLALSVTRSWREALGERGVELDWVAPQGPIEVFADDDLIAQALTNLVSNARDAAGEGGRVRVSVGDGGPGLSDRGVSDLGDGGAWVRVEDDGSGVAEDLRDQIFLPFFTTKAGGAGVGLSLARHIMRAHGGRVTLGSSDLGGASFRLEFPQAASSANP